MGIIELKESQDKTSKLLNSFNAGHIFKINEQKKGLEEKCAESDEEIKNLNSTLNITQQHVSELYEFAESN